MSGTHVIKEFWQPLAPTYDANGETTGEALAEYLLVRVEQFAGSGEGVTIKLAFADYAGLEAEWAAGSATTVLDSSLDTAIAAMTFPDATKTSAQRAFIDVEITIA